MLDALLAEAARLGVVLSPGARVTDVRRVTGDAIEVDTTAGRCVAPARRSGHRRPLAAEDRQRWLRLRAGAPLGHGYVETTPALAPLVLEGERHAPLAGVAHRRH